MTNRIFAVVALIFVTAQFAQAQNLGKYREFQLGANVASVAALTGVGPSQAKVIHQRPALMQQMEWRPRYVSRDVAPQADPVDRITFSFYNDQLYRVMVDYDARRTAGMTQVDVVTAIAAAYGTPSLPSSRTPRSAEMLYGDPDRALATWFSTEYALTLYRVSYQNGFRLVVESNALLDLARVAEIEAARLDALEKPQREMARQHQETEAARSADEEAKRVNLPAFRP